MTIPEIARETGVSPQAIHRRRLRGIPVDNWGDPALTPVEAAKKAAKARIAQTKEKGQCWIGGCCSKVLSRGLCSKHYQQDLRLMRKKA